MLNVEKRIMEDGRVIGSDILKVDSFINHQIDTKLLDEIGSYMASKFQGVNKIVTIETSGIAFACSVARYFDYCPVVFGKKSKSVITNDDSYQAKIISFTRKTESTVTIDKRFLHEGDKVLIVDDFLAEGNAALGLISMCKDANAEVLGVSVVIEKGFQPGRKRIETLGIKVESCAIIEKLENGCVTLKK